MPVNSSEAQELFYKTYEPMRKRYSLTTKIHCETYNPDSDYIEIYEGQGDDKRLLFKERGEITGCYIQAQRDLERYLKDRKEHETPKTAAG